MAVDPYGPCPCGSGKKLKFCCTDLVGEIEQIHRMIEGDQMRAALSHVEQTLRKHPGRASLLDLQVMLQSTLGDLDAAEQTLAEFSRVDPQNPSLLAQKAIVASERGDTATAVDAVQDALALVQQELPLRVLEAVGAVGHALLLEGHIVAAQAHLWLYQGIAGQEDTRALELIVKLNQSSGLPLLLRDQLYFKEVPADHPAHRTARAAADLSYEGKWKLALAKLDTLPSDQATHPSVVYNRAILNGWLGNTVALVEGFHQFAQLDVPLDDAVEAEAVAQLLDESKADKTIEVVEQFYAVRNEEELIAKLLSDRRLHAYPIDPESLDPEQGPPPRYTFLMLDREAPKSGVELTHEQVPRILGFVSYFGRQTDQPERLGLVTDRDEQFDKVLADLHDIGGDALGTMTEEKIADRLTATDRALNWRWYLPVDTPPANRRQFLADERRAAILNRWPDAPRRLLNDKSPRDAAGDSDLRIRLLAALLVLEQGNQNQQHRPLIDELRQSLGLPLPEPIETAGVEVVRLPLVRIPRLPMETVDDHTLTQLFRRSVLTGASAAILHIAREIIRRPTMHDHQVEEAYERLLTVEEDSQESLQVLESARAWSDSLGASNVRWDFLELGIHITEGRPNEATRVLNHIQQVHLQETGVAQQLYQILYSLGAIPDDKPRMRQMPPAAGPPAPATREPSRIWTPEGDAPRERPAIWTPS
ncbi:MAG: hypothetical protein WD851_24135 [Pirellulales bacterium]